MIKVGILGHSPDSFNEHNKLIHTIDDIVFVIKRQYKDDIISFITSCEPGPCQWLTQVLVEKTIPFFAYLCGNPELVSKNWTQEQQQIFLKQIDFACGIHIYDEKDLFQSRIKRDERLVDDANWILCFWNGKHQGYTFKAVQHAINNNKIVYNAFNGFTLLDKNALELESR